MPIESAGFSNRASHALFRVGVKTVGELMEYDESMLLQIPNLGKGTAKEIMQKLENMDFPIEGAELVKKEPPFRLDSEYKESILEYTKAKDQRIENLPLSNRPRNQLQKNGLEMLSDIVFLTRSDLQSLPAMGEKSITEVLAFVDAFVTANEVKIRALHDGDMMALWDTDEIKHSILSLYAEDGFRGVSFKEILEEVSLPDEYPQSELKKIIGQMLADKQLEYVDYRLYRKYYCFEEYLDKAPLKDERDREIIRRRLDGETLEEIGTDLDITRERVRQRAVKAIKKIESAYYKETGLEWFDEDYYQYFYSTYSFDKKEGSEWLGISPAIWRYLELRDIKQGGKPLAEAMDDLALDVGLKLKVKSLVNKNRVFIDGRWVDKRIGSLEEEAVRVCCQQDTTYKDFCDKYNVFLHELGISRDEKVYFTETTMKGRKNNLSMSRYLLWKQNETLRYYDIDSRDYSELLEELNIESYENIELSTAKWMREHPAIMRRYDIRDQYELHNLLRKIIPDGSYHDFHCSRMPSVKFGSFDREEAIKELLFNNAPIEADDFIDLVNEEFGYDKGTIAGTYLKCVSVYYHNGIYTVDQKQMASTSMQKLKEALPDDFYYIDEVRKKYLELEPEGDVEQINAFNLKTLGFVVRSNYVLQHFSSADSYFEHLLTENGIVDIKRYRKRFTYVVSFSNKLMQLKRDLQIVEFEPDQIIRFDRLERAGVTKEMIYDYYDSVYEFVGEGQYFSAQSIRQAGFTHELYDLGFSDWFYANLLLADERFSYGRVYGNLILFTGDESITITSFQVNRINEHESIDLYALMNEMTDVYGCPSVDRYDVVEKIKGTAVFYDEILERFYASEDAYDAELLAMETI